MDKKIALLIDAENTSVKYIGSIFAELRNYGTITYKRMYGDFTAKSLHGWSNQANEHAIVPIQQPRYSNAKNAADIMLVIDAMDIMYAKNVDIFCIVSSDSDFTRLVNRLNEEGLEVIGMGKSDASKTLKAACTIYKNLELIYGDSDDVDSEIDSSSGDSKKKKDGKSKKNPENNLTPLSEIKKSMMEIVIENENNGSRTGLGGLKSSLQRMYKDFDERNYGYSSMTRLMHELKDFEVSLEKSSVYVTLRTNEVDEETVMNYIRKQIKNEPADLSRLGQKVHTEFPDFDVKSLGYSQFGKFVQNIEGVTVLTDERNRKMVTKNKNEEIL